MSSHCGLTGCICTHDDGCYKGWLDGRTVVRIKQMRNDEPVAIVTDAVAFCPTCHPEQARIMRNALSREDGLKQLSQRGMTHRIAERAEQDRSRTL